jgi:D-3-phosphoglycerate dehydrogenase / 2-oxoglutarate reductase
MKSYQVARTHLSPYQSKDFLSREKEIVEQIHGLTYRSISELKDEETILITNTHTQLKDLPNNILRKTGLIIHPNSGYDHFSDEHALWEKIPLVIGHTIRAQAVAEYSLGALFQGLVELPQHILWNKDRNWNRTLLKGTSIWIFGYGHIGSIIADTLDVLGMEITIVDPFISECRHRLLKNWKDGHLKEAKVIIAATSLNKTSFHMFNEDFFHSTREDVLFINGARGKLVEEKALKEFLLSHPQALAFLDVFEKEPFSEEWHGFPQVWKTSHIAGVEENLDKKILEFERSVLNDFLNMNEFSFFKKYEKELIQNKWIKGVLI